MRNHAHLLPSVGHIGIAVPDVYAACKLFEEQGVTFVKKPDDGGYNFKAFPQHEDIVYIHQWKV